MATYTELNTIISDPALKEKVKIALLVAADAVRTEDAGTANHANRLKWAAKVLRDPNGNADYMMRALIGQYDDQSVAAITGATDATIQTAVNNAIDTFADGT